MEERNFKITLSCYDKTVTIERDYPDITITDAIEDMVAGLFGLTFSQDQIIKGMSEYIGEHSDIEQLC